MKEWLNQVKQQEGFQGEGMAYVYNQNSLIPGVPTSRMHLLKWIHKENSHLRLKIHFKISVLICADLWQRSKGNGEKTDFSTNDARTIQYPHTKIWI